MKKLIILSLFALASCSEKSDSGVIYPISPVPTGLKVHSAGMNNAAEISVVLLDGCEYYVYNVAGNTGLMTHKGNCKNAIHQCPCK